jgi:hypothetical protein
MSAAYPLVPDFSAESVFHQAKLAGLLEFVLGDAPILIGTVGQLEIDDERMRVLPVEIVAGRNCELPNSLALLLGQNG